MKVSTKSKYSGFTIVELLVVIVVIGILATLTIISYAGISKKADIASLQSDLNGAKKQLDLYYVDHGSFPTSLINVSVNTYCPSDDLRYCIKTSPNNSFGLSYTPIGSPPQSYSLDANKGTTIYRITNNTTAVAVTTTPITTIGNITGTTSVGSVLTAGALTPILSTVIYQWQSALSSGGIYTDISGATSSTYTIQSSDWPKYIKVVATATGNYTGTQTSTSTAIVIDSNWIGGIALTAMTGKYVRNADLGSDYKFKSTNDSILSPQGLTGLDPNFLSNMSLVSPQANPSVDFSLYSAQNACKTIGGRLPNMNELLAVYSGRVTSYGNNFQVGSYYWSSTEYDGGRTYSVSFWDGSPSLTNYKTYTEHIRCVSG